MIMGENSKIECTDHTFNPWIGCTKVSPGCAHCYAETLNNRMGWTKWGDDGKRVRTSNANWAKPLRWDLEASRLGTRKKVFCASLADWLDHKAPTAWRVDLLELIRKTPYLDWLLLTKRPESWYARMHEAIGAGSILASSWLDGEGPENVWVGTSVENQKVADERIYHLADIPARIRFLSVEPLLSPLDLSAWLGDPVPLIHWVIVGGESGPGARPMSDGWVRHIRNQCWAASVPFFFKQW